MRKLIIHFSLVLRCRLQFPSVVCYHRLVQKCRLHLPIVVWFTES
jgi:hypothetical protein